MAQGRKAQASGKRKVLQELSENFVRINQKGENQEHLYHRELDMAVRHVRFIFVKEELSGKSIINYSVTKG